MKLVSPSLLVCYACVLHLCFALPLVTKEYVVYGHLYFKDLVKMDMNFLRLCVDSDGDVIVLRVGWGTYWAKRNMFRASR